MNLVMIRQARTTFGTLIIMLPSIVTGAEVEAQPTPTNWQQSVYSQPQHQNFGRNGRRSSRRPRVFRLPSVSPGPRSDSRLLVAARDDREPAHSPPLLSPDDPLEVEPRTLVDAFDPEQILDKSEVQAKLVDADGSEVDVQVSNTRTANPAIDTEIVDSLLPDEELEEEVERIPDDFVPWWELVIGQPLRPSTQGQTVDVESMILEALRFSPRVRAINENTGIRATAIIEADAEFDVHAFVETKLNRTSEPTGSTLDAGTSVTRLREEDWFYKGGVRRKSRVGGEWEVAQRYGLRNSNSTFFTPQNQGNSRLTLSYTQPLLNGYGELYNRSLIVLAEIDTRAACDRTSRELQDHLLAVTETMWQLYLDRAVLLQKQRNLQRAVEILAELEARTAIDSMASQLARARAAVATRRTELVRASASIRNMEARLRSLVRSPALTANVHQELLPMDRPRRDRVQVAIRDAFITAMDNRPEVDEAMLEIQSASVRMDMAQNELKPVLDVILETYVTGLDGNYDVGHAWLDQFREGEPGFTAGFLFEVPIHNRAARARYQRRQRELKQLTSQFEDIVGTLRTEVEIAVREVSTSFHEMQSNYHAMQAAVDDVGYLQRRWELLPGEDRAASFLLEDLLDAQDRLAAEEFGFSKAQGDYTLSLAQLKRVTGTLLQRETLRPLAPHAVPPLEEIAPPASE